MTRHITCHIKHHLSQISQITRKHPQDTFVTPFWKYHRVFPIRAMLYGIITVPWRCWGGDISKLLSHKNPELFSGGFWNLYYVMCDVWHVMGPHSIPKNCPIKMLPYIAIFWLGNFLWEHFHIPQIPILIGITRS